MSITETDYKTSCMIALLPVDGSWSSVDIPHLTLVYCGDIETDLQPTDFNKIAKDASSLSMMNSPLTLQATGVEIFGEGEERVDVLKYKMTSELDAMRHMVEDWNQSEYEDFKPHITIGPPGSHVMLPYIPKITTFDKLYVGWGDQCLTFRMTSKGGTYV